MKGWIGFGLAICLLLAACGRLPAQTAAPPSPTASMTSSPVSPSPTASPTVTSTATPAPTQTPTPSPTITATPPPGPAEVLAGIIQSDRWAGLGLEAEQAARWEAFAAGSARLTAGELRQLNDFLQQWRSLDELTSDSLVDQDTQPAFRVMAGEDEDGQPRWVLYAALEGEGEDQLFLTARDRHGKAVGLALAPAIEGLSQRISGDGRYVEYVEAGGRKVLLLADARKLDEKQDGETLLKKRLDELYHLNSDYAQASTYPRFFFPTNQVEAGFFNLEQSLTFSQILQMNEAFDLFERPELAPLKPAFFGPEISVLIIERLSQAAGLNYSGTGVVELDRRDLFGNKYYLAEVLAHEGSHVLQGGLNTRDACREIMRREVGDHTIPDDFYRWTADELVQAVKDEQVGAYHVSLWVFNELGMKGEDMNWLRDVIHTGQANGQPVVIACR